MADQYDDNDTNKCTYGANVISYQMNEHITRGIHARNLNLKKNDIILEPIITIENITFNNCPTCELYIDSRKYNDHINLNCIYTTLSLPPNYLKGRIRCISNKIIKNKVNYISHLTSESHKYRSPKR